MAKDNTLYYIQNGYVGNAVLWWALDDKGYTSDITQAQKYSKTEAENICRQRNGQDKAWPVDYIDGNEKARKLIIDSQYLESKKILKWPKK